MKWNLASMRLKPLKARDLTFSKDDVLIVSYPKSGSTWLRFLIANYLTHNKCTFLNHHELIPDIHDSMELVYRARKPRIIKSHLPFTPSYKKVIYLVRDGRDVAVSYYYHLKKYGKLEKTVEFSEYLNLFNLGNCYDEFGSWEAHIHSWLDCGLASSEDFLLIRYEDVKHDTVNSFTKVLKFLNLDIDQERVEKAIHASSLENMKELENQQQDLGKHLKFSDKSIKFVRNGATGDWHNLFSKSDLDIFLAKHGDALKRLDYFE